MFSFIEGLEESFFIFSILGHIPQVAGFAYFTGMANRTEKVSITR
ncbi:hypothetical protein [Sulfoacidibacillus ferrooxidans]|uniref:Uncharacterized protein n=1 Tax=Sulfoacidibacillus ferrooxidans TaxID=2005001 RepID=A0A9X1VAT2_9BACL|nr:hypothetical protein [Sulfoacidibacillus ferrooxidans]MCI0184454.1 hypothetical protein [Sulfoacidibacillus ferrooxidans]